MLSSGEVENARVRLRSALVFVSGLVLTGCVTSVLPHELAASGDAWTVKLTSLTDGPDSVVTTGFPSYRWEAGNGRKFIHAFVDIRNDAKGERKFSFNRCDLDDPQGVVVPSVVSTTVVIAEAGRTATIAPGESLSRQLVFSVAKHYSPKRLSCAPMVFTLPVLEDR
jgi:hypothetical protein